MKHSRGRSKKKEETKEKLDKKRVTFSLGKDEPTSDNEISDEKENIKDIANLQEERKSRKEVNLEREMEENKAIQDELYRVRDNSTLIERTKQEIDEIRRQYEIELYGKSSDGIDLNNNEKLLKQIHPDPQGSADPSDVFILKPDPIMRLNQ